MVQKAKYTLKVRNYHIDAYGHVNSAVYLNFLEEARTTFLEEMGVSIEDLLKQGIFIYLADIAVQFKKPAQLGDQLEIWGWYDEVKKVKLCWRQEIVNSVSGELIAVARTTGAFLKQGKIIPIPPEIRQKLLAFLWKPDR
ncbi:MAG: acyl-CoA thioesterase [Syntrophomonadaceae bacterium]|nr:acyl-CoA thioesterase [Syntrophomonadaceae bacterium]